MLKFIIGLFLSLSSMVTIAQGRDPVSWKIVTEQVDSLTYQVSLQAVIKKPYHIYPIKSSGGGLGMPTSIVFEQNSNIDFLGSIAEKGLEENQGKQLPYYKEGVSFSQKIKLKDDKSQLLELTVKYMACNDRMCLPPAKQTFSVMINGDQINSGIEVDMADSSVAPIEERPYQDFEMIDTEGKVVSSHDIVRESAYTFIDFWASWCSPCRVQGKALIPLFQKYKSDGLRVIAISLDTSQEKWVKAIEADGYTWTNLSDLKGFESPLAKYYDIKAIPRNFLIDPQGNIIARDLHGQDLENKLAELFKN